MHIMKKLSIAQTLPTELLELIFSARIELDAECLKAAFDRKEEKWLQRHYPARAGGPARVRPERQFAGSHTVLRACLSVCRGWYLCVRGQPGASRPATV